MFWKKIKNVCSLFKGFTFYVSTPEAGQEKASRPAREGEKRAGSGRITLISTVIIPFFTFTIVVFKMRGPITAMVSISKTEYSKSEQLLLELRAKAILKAKRNAEHMVEPLNQKIGKAIYVSDLETASITSQLQGKVAGVQIRGASSIYRSRAKEDIMIDFEKMEFSAKVKVKFIIE